MVTSQKLLYFYTEINVNAYVLYRGYIVKANNVIKNEARFAFYSIQKNCKIKSDNTQSLISSVNIEKSGIPFNMNMVIILQTYIVNAYVFVIPT